MFVSEIFDEASEILGTTDQGKIFRVLTQAVQILMESGHWFHTQQEIDVCTGWDGMTVTLPREVEVPLAVQVDGSPLYFRSRFFAYGVNRGNKFDSVCWAWDDKGSVATIMDIRQPSQLVAVAEHSNDVGKKIRVIGTDQWNRPLRTQLKDGTLLDGLLATIHSQNDFAYGTIRPDDTDVETRTAAIGPISEFTTSTPHTLTSGEPMVFTLGSSTVSPSEITVGNTYYVGVSDPTTLQLFSSPANAVSGINPILLHDITGVGTFNLTDSRTAEVNSQITLSAVPALKLGTVTEVTFEGTLPTPLLPNLTYFATVINSTHLQIFASVADASNGNNPIYLSGTSGSFTIYFRSPIAPQTTLNFSAVHYFRTGDSVTVNTNGGSLPQPLIAGQTYYVYAIDSYNITLHTSLQDAMSGANPITFTTLGSGNNVVARLLQATVTLGSSGNVKVANFNGIVPTPATPSGVASVQAINVGSVTQVGLSSGGTGYSTTPTVAVWDVGGAGYTASDVSSTQPAMTYTATDASGNWFNFIGSILGLGISLTKTSDYISAVSITGSSGASVSGLPVGGYVFLIGQSGGIGAVLQITNGTITAGDSTSISSAGIVSHTGGLQFVSPCVAFGGTPASVSSLAPVSAAIPGLILNSGGAGYWTTPRLSFSAGNASATCQVTKSFVSKYLVVLPGAGYAAAPYLSLTPGGDNTASAIATLSNGGISQVSPVSEGTKYTTAPSVTVSVSTGAFATFSSTGTLPAPLVFGTAYRIEDPSPTGFTVKNADFSLVDITSPGSGTLYVELSNSFGVSYNNIWGGDFSSFQTGQSLYFGADYLLPTTTPSLPTSTSSSALYLRKISNTTGYLYSSNTNLTNPLFLNATAWDAQTVYSAGATVVYGNKVYQAVVALPEGVLPTTTSPGSGASATAILTQPPGYISYVVSQINLSANGQGYFVPPSISFSGGNVSTPATGHAVVSGGLLTGIVIDSRGVYFSGTPAPSVVITPVSSPWTYLFDTPNLVVVNQLGTGQAYYAVPDTAATATILNNSIVPSSIGYLSSGTSVTFSSTGSLPSGISSGTSYLITVSGKTVTLSTTSGTPVTLASLGSGILTMTVTRTVTASPSTFVVAESSIYENGTALYFRSADGDVLDPSLAALASANTPAYVRRVDENSFELYDTYSHAINPDDGNKTGRISYTKIGNTLASTFFTDALGSPILVKRIDSIHKPESDGYVSLYAWDYGRSNDTTLIGQYHPTETDPKYRRIKVGNPCAWVRVLYRAKAPKISSVYDYIPIEHARAILSAVHAVDLEDKDFAEQADRYWAKAYKYLVSQHESFEGHAMQNIQVNNLTYGDRTDCVMF